MPPPRWPRRSRSPPSRLLSAPALASRAVWARRMCGPAEADVFQARSREEVSLATIMEREREKSSPGSAPSSGDPQAGLGTTDTRRALTITGAVGPGSLCCAPRCVPAPRVPGSPATGKSGVSSIARAPLQPQSIFRLPNVQAVSACGDGDEPGASSGLGGPQRSPPPATGVGQVVAMADAGAVEGEDDGGTGAPLRSPGSAACNC